MDETLLLAAVCGSREAYEHALRIGVATNDLTETGRVVFDAASEQYRRDTELQTVSRDLLRAQVERRYGKGSMADSVMEFVDRFPRDVSKVNVTEEYRLLRLSRCSTHLATLLASGQHGDETREVLDSYKSLIDGEEGSAVKDRLELDDWNEDGEDRIMLHPALRNYIGAGVRRGHNVTIFGRPNSCKSMLALDIAARTLHAGHRVLYVANEEPAQDITVRLLSRLARIKTGDLANSAQARAAAFKRAADDYTRWHLLHKGAVTANDIRRQCARIKPALVIVDQLKNVQTAEDNRALQLDKLARQVREIGIDNEAVTISVTQAGESAEGKLVLGMTDVEWSNTGIPGAADLMIGIGVNHEFDSQNKRMLSICKNKVKPEHGAFPVWIDTDYTRISGRAL